MSSVSEPSSKRSGKPFPTPIMPTFLSLPQSALDRIMDFLAVPCCTDRLRSTVTTDNEVVPLPIAQEIPCHHAFARPAFNLALTCKIMYSIYNMKILHMVSSLGGEFLTPNCKPHICLTPIFDRLHSFKILRKEITSADYDCQFTLRKVASSFWIPNYFSKMDIVKDNDTDEVLFKIPSVLREKHLTPVFQIACCFTRMKRLEVVNCTEILTPAITKLVADAWSQTLHEFIVDDFFMTDIQGSLASLGKLVALKTLRLSSQRMRTLQGLANLSNLRTLELCFCSIHDFQFDPLIRFLPDIEHLDISDTYISPNITDALPLGLVSLSIGEKDRHARAPSPENSFYAKIIKEYANCSCFAFLPDCKHLPTCETYVPNEINPRWATQNHCYLNAKSFPQLKNLEWGHWGQFAQGITSLQWVLPAIQKLTLSGKDYDDKICTYLDAMVCLRELSLLGCNVTDNTAFEVAKMLRIEFLDISNCVLITSIGLYTLANGEGARIGKLKAIRTNVDETPVTPAVIRDDLLENEFTRADIHGSLLLDYAPALD